MPYENNFQHSKYSRTNPSDRVAYGVFNEEPIQNSPAWQEVMAKTGSRFRCAGVRGVLFLNSIPLPDVFGMGRLDKSGGLNRGYSRGIPGLESLLAVLRPETNGLLKKEESSLPISSTPNLTESQVDDLVGDIGNFSRDYVQLFSESINRGSSDHLECTKYLCFSLPHHVGRVGMALEFLEYLYGWRDRLSCKAGERILVLAHGQAGLVMALISNLITPGESSGRQLIFESLASHVKRVQGETKELDRLDRLFRWLNEGTFLNGAVLDVVTFGTPIRCGWDLSGIGHLLHFVNHRPIRGDGKQWLGKMELPQIAWEIPMLSGGDFVQQLAVAGTDMVPDSEVDQQLNEDLRDVIEPYDGFEQWLECVRRGTRCANDGYCRLIDYQVSPDLPPRAHLFGHGCYTRENAMLFHTMEIQKIFYPS